MVVVPKSDGSLRICVDLTRLNQNVQRERHPIPSVDHTLVQLGGAKIFSKLVYGRDQGEHNSRLMAVLECLKQARVILNKGKCCFSVDRVTFLGPSGSSSLLVAIFSVIFRGYFCPLHNIIVYYLNGFITKTNVTHCPFNANYKL